jgi:hypothetical protein
VRAVDSPERKEMWLAILVSKAGEPQCFAPRYDDKAGWRPHLPSWSNTAARISASPQSTTHGGDPSRMSGRVATKVQPSSGVSD